MGKGEGRYPDVVIAMNFNRFDEGMKSLRRECTMCNVPLIGILDTDCNPLGVTYPIPGNDDTVVAMETYCDIFKTTIMNVKEKKTLAQYNFGQDPLIIDGTKKNVFYTPS